MIVFTAIIIILPYFQRVQYNFGMNTLTAILLVVSVAQLQIVVVRVQGLIAYIVIALLARIISNNSFADNFAICCAFTSNAAFVDKDKLNWNIVINLLIWSYFSLAFMNLHIQRRSSVRIWENTQAIIILREKTNQEKLRGEEVICAHFPPEVLRHLFPSSELDSTASFVSEKSFTMSTMGDVKSERVKKNNFARKSGQSFVNTSRLERSQRSNESERNISDDIVVRDALAEGLIPQFSESRLTLQQLRAIDGVDRRSAAIVVVRRIMHEHSGSAAASLNEDNFQLLLTALATRHRVTAVRMFGESWVGCIGFFDSWGSDLADCQHIVQFACELSQLERHVLGEVALAVDFGNIVGGFLDSLCFDLFGQEIRWLLMMAELRLAGKVILGDALRHIMDSPNSRRNSKEGVEALSTASKAAGTSEWDLLETNQLAVHPPWKLKSTIAVRFIANANLLINNSELQSFVQDFAAKNDMQRNSVLFKDDSIDCDLSTNCVETSFDAFSTECHLDSHLGATPNVASSPGSMSYLESLLQSHYPQYAGLYHRLLKSEQPSRLSEFEASLWKEDIGIEFLTSTFERYGISVEEKSVLPPDKMNEAHREIVAKVIKIVWKRCFTNTLRLLSLCSAYTHDKKIVVEVNNTGATIESKLNEDDAVFGSPLEAVFGFLSHTVLYCQSISYLVFSLAETSKRNIASSVKRYVGDRPIEPEEDFISTGGLDNYMLRVSLARKNKLSSDAKSLPSVGAVFNSWQFREHSVYSYCRDCTLCTHNGLINALINCVAHAMSIFIVLLVSNTGHDYSLLPLLCLHLVVSIVIAGRYDTYMFLILMSIRITLLMLNTKEFCSSATQNEFIISVYYNVVGQMVNYIGRLPNAFRMPALLAFIENTVSIVVIMVVIFSDDQYCHRSMKNVITILFVRFLQIISWSLEYRAYVSYIIEHVLLPAAHETYQRQRKNTDLVVAAFVPNSKIYNAENFKRSYRHCTIVGIHIKVADILGGFLDANDLSVLLKQAQSIIKECIAECDMVKLCNFSGVCFAASHESSALDLHSSSKDVMRGVTLLRILQSRMEQFSRDHNFNMPLGIALNNGTATLSFHYNQFNISGRARDMTLAMATFHTDGIFATEIFENEIIKGSAISDSVQRQTNVIVGANRHQWLRIDGSFAGMQLDDFNYIGMLGRGGYGSVHLVREKQQGHFYAVKSILLKQGSMMSKMIARECIILQMMQHPNVVSLKYSFISNSRLYLVMSYIRGGNLKQVVERDRLGFQQLQLWFAELVLAIEYVHSIGIIHRDIKPANCMIGADGHLKLADFGLSKIVRSSRKERTTADHSSGSDALQLSSEAYNKILQFLPLKINIANYPKKSGVTVLLVSSDTVNTDTLTSLRGLGFEILKAKTSTEAMSVLRGNNEVEAILIDLCDEITDSDSLKWAADDAGIRLLEEFCVQLYNSIPVFVVCGCDEVTSCRIVAVGARHCFQKPLDTNEIISVMSQTISISEHLPTTRMATTTSQFNLAPSISESDKSLYSTSGEYSGQNYVKSTSFDSTSSVDDVVCDSIHIEEDFRIARRLSLQDEHVNSFERDYQDHSAVGTLHFIAPEVIKVQKYGKSVDWWACGVTFYECLVRSHLFRGDDKQEVFDNILEGPIDLSPLQEFGQPIVDLVSGLLNRDIKCRLGTHSTEKIKAHAFFTTVNWQTISFSDPAYKPAQFVSRKLDLKDKVLFYGPVDRLETVESNPKSSLAAKNILSLKRFQSNQKRVHKSKRGIDRSNAKHNVGYAMSAAAQAKRKLLVSGELSILQTIKSITAKNSSKQKRDTSWSNLMSSDSFHFSADDEDSVEDEKDGDDSTVHQF